MLLENKVSVGVDGAAEATGLGQTLIRKAITAGELRSHRAGARIVILVEDLRAWIASLPTGAAS